MKVKELLEQLKGVNPEADVLLREVGDWEQTALLSVETDPTTEKELTGLVMLWGDFSKP